MDVTDKIECENCQKVVSECLCPPSACIACTRLFIPEMMKMHASMCGNLQETCVFCEHKYFVRDRPVHRRSCDGYKEYCAERLFYTQALEHWTRSEDALRYEFDIDLLVEYVGSLINRMDTAALELKRRRKALLYLRQRAQKNRFVPSDFASLGLGPDFSPINFPPLPPPPPPRPSLPARSAVSTNNRPASPLAATCTAVIPYVPLTGLPLQPPPPPPPPGQLSPPTAIRQRPRLYYTDVVAGVRDSILATHTPEADE